MFIYSMYVIIEDVKPNNFYILCDCGKELNTYIFYLKI